MLNELAFAFDQPGATVATAGGKGSALCNLFRAGFPVPPGFVLTTEAYRGSLRHNGLEARIGEAMRAARDETALRDVSRDLCASFARGTLPEYVDDALIQAYCDLPRNPQAGPPPIAVRSSATWEDGAGSSFAGQHETILNVRDEWSLREAVKRCWASLWTPRALAYRSRLELGREAGEMAVVVQVLVPASASGVLFTANPLTGNRDEIVIEAAWGLGQTLVNGRITPDTVIVGRGAAQVKSIRVGDKTVMAVPGNEGVVMVAVEDRHRFREVLLPEECGEARRPRVPSRGSRRAPPGRRMGGRLGGALGSSRRAR